MRPPLAALVLTGFCHQRAIRAVLMALVQVALKGARYCSRPGTWSCRNNTAYERPRIDARTE